MGASLIGLYEVTTVTDTTLTLTCQGTGSVDATDSVSAEAALVIAGTSGSNGTNGTNRQSAYTLTSATYTQPAIGATVNVAVDSSSWTAVGAIIYESGGSYFEVMGIPDATHLTLKNLGYPGNTAPGGTLGGLFVPAGIAGPDAYGPSTPGDWNGTPPTTIS